MLFVCCLFEYRNKNIINMAHGLNVVFFRKRKWSHHTLITMAVKNRFIENMTFLLRLEQARAQTTASIETKERS